MLRAYIKLGLGYVLFTYYILLCGAHSLIIRLPKKNEMRFTYWTWLYSIMKSFSFLPFLVLVLKSLKVAYHFNLYLTIRQLFPKHWTGPMPMVKSLQPMSSSLAYPDLLSPWLLTGRLTVKQPDQTNLIAAAYNNYYLQFYLIVQSSVSKLT